MDFWIQFFGEILPACIFGTTGNVVLRASKIATRNNKDIFWQGILSMVFGLIVAYALVLVGHDSSAKIAALLTALGGSVAAEKVQNFSVNKVGEATKTGTDAAKPTSPDNSQEP